MSIDNKKHYELAYDTAKRMHKETLKERRGVIRRHNRNVITMVQVFVGCTSVMGGLVFFNILVQEFISALMTMWLLVVLIGYYLYAINKISKIIFLVIKNQNKFIKKNKGLMESAKKCLEQKNI